MILVKILIQLVFDDSERKTEMKTQFLQQPDGTIAYDDSGHGPLVVCFFEWYFTNGNLNNKHISELFKWRRPFEY